jgi:dienelactone hydrolase
MFQKPQLATSRRRSVMKSGRGYAPGVLLLIAGLFLWCRESQYAYSQAAPDPGQRGPCAVSSCSVIVEEDLEVDVYYPSEDQCGETTSSPYPAVVFAHGFSMFGLSDGAAENADNGAHLASWGYITAIPQLPDDAQERLAAVQDVLAYLESANNTPGSFVYGRIDLDRLAAAGHSLGGTTALALAAEDSRPKAIVALDPVYHAHDESGQSEEQVWDPAVEAPDVDVPTAILGAPSQECNSDGDYAEIYPLVGSVHKASFLVVGGSHCDFADPGSSFCGFLCGVSADPARTELAQKYMTAWFNYYLNLDPDYYTYIYGDEADADIAADRIERDVSTAPRNLAAEGQEEEIVLNWDLYDHAIVAGYNIYRSAESGSYLDYPCAQVGPVSFYVDHDVVAGQRYFYTLRSRDPAGNEHQASDEVSAVCEAPPPPTETPDGEASYLVYMPLVLRSITSDE